MKRILFAFISMYTAALCATTPLLNADKLINQIDPTLNIGILVTDLTTGQTLYQRNAGRLFIPASNMKLFSDAVALIALGPDYQFKTQLSTNANHLESGRLNGDLVLNFSGDPSLTKKQLADLLSALAELHINTINGDVVLVSNNSHVNAYAPGWSAKDLKYSYGAPLAPLVLDENRLLVTVNPGTKANDKALIEFPNASAFNLDNQVKTAASGAACGVDFIMDGQNHLLVRGCIGVGQWAIQQRIAIRNPLKYSQALIQNELNRLGIKLQGQIRLGQVQKGSLLIASHASKPISQLLSDTLKPSDNLYADSLFLHTAAYLHGAPVNWDTAQQVIKKFLQQQTGIDLQQAVLTDGSGLSRQDLLTPQQTVKLLQFLHERFPLSYEYIAALPVAGRDGTLQRRLRLPSQQGFVRAKTGTMSGIIGLSGYLYTANGHTLAFAMFINRTPKTKPSVAGKYRYLVDALCDFFLKQTPNNYQMVAKTNAHSRLAFQQGPTPADKIRAYKARWRHIEANVKQGVKGQAVVVLFRNDHLLIKDDNADPNKVWAVLQAIHKKYKVAVSMQGQNAPSHGAQPFLLWIKSNQAKASRVWTVREAV